MDMDSPIKTTPCIHLDWEWRRVLQH